MSYLPSQSVCISCVCVWVYTVCARGELMQLQFLFALPRRMKCWQTHSPKLTLAITPPPCVRVCVRACVRVRFTYKHTLILGLMFWDRECYVVGRGRIHTNTHTPSKNRRFTRRCRGSEGQLLWKDFHKLTSEGRADLYGRSASTPPAWEPLPLGALIVSLMIFLLKCWN